MSTVILESVLTCPNCGQKREEVMPTDACQYFYECKSCKALLKPKAGDCCVFCSYGSVACPPFQEQRSCCQRAPTTSTVNVSGTETGRGWGCSAVAAGGGPKSEVTA